MAVTHGLVVACVLNPNEGGLSLTQPIVELEGSCIELPKLSIVIEYTCSSSGLIECTVTGEERSVYRNPGLRKLICNIRLHHLTVLASSNEIGIASYKSLGRAVNWLDCKKGDLKVEREILISKR